MNYPVTTPYGQVPGYPLNNGFHTGIDYGYPMGTPVVVNGVTIGLSNNTGDSTGPHLHVGKYVNGQVQDPGVGNGFSFDSAVVYDTGSDSVNGNYVRIMGDGALWNYLHLQTVLVSKGQLLKGGDDMKPTREGVIVAYQVVLQETPTEEQINAQLGQASMADVLRSLDADHKARFVPKADFDNVFGIADQRFKNEKTVADLVNVSNPDDAESVVAKVKALKDSQGGSGYTEADRATDQETNSIVKQIWNKLTGLFK